MEQALRSSIAITGLRPRLLDEVIDLVKKEVLLRGGAVEREELISIVKDVLSAFGGEERYEVWERYRELRREGKYDKPLFFLLSGASATGKSVVGTDVIGRFAITRIYSTDSVRQIVRITYPKPTVMVHTWEAKEHLDEREREELRDRFGDLSDNLLGYLSQTLWVVEKGLKPLVERLEQEGANAFIEGVHLLPGEFTGENHAFAVLSVPYEIHRAFVLVKGRRRELKDIGSTPEDREKEFRLIREVHDFLVERARQLGVPVVEFSTYEETVSSFIDVVYERVKHIVEVYG